MLRTIVFALAIIIPAGSVAAQDISPVISPGQAAEGAYYRSMMEAQAARDRQRNGQARVAAAPANATERQRQACANRPLFRQQYGANHPKVQQLEALCRQAGY